MKLFDSASSSYLWDVASEITFPRCVEWELSCCVVYQHCYFLSPRILSIACGPATFAVSASDTAVPSFSSSLHTLTLTSPTLPSHRASAEMVTLKGKGGSGGGGGEGGGGGGGGRGRGMGMDLPIPGGVYIWDLKTQKMKVMHNHTISTCM